MRAQEQKTQSILMGVRPEHIVLLPENSTEGIAASLEVFEMMGSEMYLHVTVLKKVFVIKIQTSEQTNLYSY